MFKQLLFVWLVFSLTVHSFAVSGQIQPAWTRTIQSFPTSVFDAGNGGVFPDTPWFTDVKYSNGQVFTSGTFNGARARFGNLMVYADTSALLTYANPSALDFHTGFVAATGDNGNFSWVSTIYSNDPKPSSFVAPMADLGTVARLAVGSDGSLFASGLVVGDSVYINGQLQYALTSTGGFPALIGYLVKFSPTGQVLWSRFWVCSPDFTLNNSACIPIQLFTNEEVVHVHLYAPGITYNNTIYNFGPNVLRSGIIRFDANGAFQSAGPLPDPLQDGGSLALSTFNPKTRNLCVAENNNFNPSFSARHSQISKYDSLLNLVQFLKVSTVSGIDTLGSMINSLIEDADGNLIGIGEAQGLGAPVLVELLVAGRKKSIGINQNASNTLKFIFRVNKDGCLQWVRPINVQKIHDQGFMQLENGALVGIGTASYSDYFPIQGGIYPLDSCRVIAYDRNGNQTQFLDRIEFPQTTVRAWNSSFFGTPNAFSQMTSAPNGFVAINGRGLFRYEFQTLPSSGIDETANISPAGPVNLCPGSNIALTASEGTSYLWSPGGSTSGTIFTNGPGLYSVKIGQSEGCFGYASIQVRNVNPIAVNAGPGAQGLVNSGNIQLNGLPSGGTWSGNGISPSGAFSTALAPGVYPVVYTIVEGGCEFRDTTLVTLLPQTSGGVNPPQASLPGGTYQDPIQVSLTTSTPGAVIYYTTSGNTPKVGAGFTRLYTGPIPILQTTTLKSIAVKAGETDSPVTVATFTIQNSGIVAIPEISPGSGNFSTVQMVTLSTTSPGASIYYTTNGNLPVVGTPNLFTRLYTAPFPVSRTTTIRALAVKAGLLNSPVAVANLTFTVPAETAPVVFSPGPGSFSEPVAVEMSCATPGAVIYYTTNGNIPRSEIPNFFTRMYSTPVLLTTSRTLRAVAVAPGLASGPVASGIYSLGGGFRSNVGTSSSRLEAYPNPTYGKLKVSFFSAEGSGHLRIMDLQGKEVYGAEVLEGTEQVSLNLDGLPAGLYRIQFRHSTGIENLTFVKQ